MMSRYRIALVATSILVICFSTAVGEGKWLAHSRTVRLGACTADAAHAQIVASRLPHRSGALPLQSHYGSILQHSPRRSSGALHQRLLQQFRHIQEDEANSKCPAGCSKYGTCNEELGRLGHRQITDTHAWQDRSMPTDTMHA